MATSPLFGWEEPDDTDLVKDGAAAIRTLGNAIDTSMGDLLGGTTGQILSKNSNTNMDFTWITNDVGDITAVTAGTGLTGGGTSGAVTLSLDTTAVTGPAFRAFRSTTNQSFSQSTWTKVQLNGESYDTASCFDSTTNYRFTPNKAGYYQLNCSIWEERSGSGLIYAGIYKNGDAAALNGINTSATTNTTMVSDLIYFNGTTDYVEMWVFDQAGTSREVLGVAGTSSWLSGTWIRS